LSGEVPDWLAKWGRIDMFDLKKCRVGISETDRQTCTSCHRYRYTVCIKSGFFLTGFEPERFSLHPTKTNLELKFTSLDLGSRAGQFMPQKKKYSGYFEPKC
jgi:hypothetical protein